MLYGDNTLKRKADVFLTMYTLSQTSLLRSNELNDDKRKLFIKPGRYNNFKLACT